MFKDNPDFFPTPKALQRMMLSKIEWSKVQTCLEPSAGGGDLVEGIMKQFEYTQRYRGTKKYDVDLIEIDTNLIHILKGKGYRVVADDFLHFQTYKSYDCIVANFPFSQGDRHALHAIKLAENQMKSCQLVFLINGETLKNPYSNSRKELIQKLDEYNANVEFIQNAFTNADRKTDVETAIVHMSVKKVPHNSVILERLKQEEIHSDSNIHNNNYLIDSDFIKGIVQQYNYEVKAGLKLIEEYNSLKPLMLRSFTDDNRPVLKLGLEYEDNEGSSLENAYIKQIRLKYWTTLFSNDQFMSLFTSNLKQKYLQYVNELKDYDFSFYNIYSIRVQLNKEMVKGVEDTILNLFDEFSYKHYYDESSKNVHLYNGWKTNKAWKINKKVIIPLNGFNGWFDRQYRPTDYTVLDKLKDIEKVFNYLDAGQTEEIDMTDTLKMAEHYQETKKIDLKYFYVTFYKKGTCHLEFKCLELLHKFNLFGSQRKGWLPPSYGKVKYSDMTAEEKEVINGFEGESSYNNVMKNASYYIMKTEELLKLTS